jgi:hypothetical protein
LTLFGTPLDGLVLGFDILRHAKEKKIFISSDPTTDIHPTLYTHSVTKNCEKLEEETYIFNVSHITLRHPTIM